jgi:hypothetical protein
LLKLEPRWRFDRRQAGITGARDEPPFRLGLDAVGELRYYALEFHNALRDSCKLVMLKESTELASAAKTHELLVPFEYTRLDKMIGVAFTVAEEVSEAVEEEQTPADAAADIDSPKQRPTPWRRDRTSAD